MTTHEQARMNMRHAELLAEDAAAQAAEQAREAGGQSAPAPSGSQPPSREAASAQLKNIASDPAHAYWHKDHPGYQAAVAEVQRLNEIALMQPGKSIRGTPPPSIRGPLPPTQEAGGNLAQVDPSSGLPAPPPLPEDLPAPPAGQKWDPYAVAEINTTAADLGATPDQTQELLGYLTRFSPPADEAAIDAAYAAGEKTLKAEWGPQYDARMEAARFVYSRLPLSLQVGIDEAGLGSDPVVIRRFAELGAPMMAAKAEIEQIMADPRHAYFDRRHPQHEKAVLHVRRLHERAHGKRPVIAEVPFRAGTE